jgi:hypothetical protein
MAARYILLAIAVTLVIAAATRRFSGLQARTWLIVAGIFALVSAWLFSRG